MGRKGPLRAGFVAALQEWGSSVSWCEAIGVIVEGDII